MGNRLFLGRFGGGRKLVAGETGASVAASYWGFRGFVGGCFPWEKGQKQAIFSVF